MASVTGPPKITKRSPSQASESFEEGEKGDAEQTTYLADPESQDSKSDAVKDTLFTKYEPFILGITAAVILGWWISATVLKATRHRWYVGASFLILDPNLSHAFLSGLCRLFSRGSLSCTRTIVAVIAFVQYSKFHRVIVFRYVPNTVVTRPVEAVWKPLVEKPFFALHYRVRLAIGWLCLLALVFGSAFGFALPEVRKEWPLQGPVLKRHSGNKLWRPCHLSCWIIPISARLLGKLEE